MATRSKRTSGKKRATVKKRTAATTGARPKKRGSGRRDLVKAKNAMFFAKRSARGRFKEMDE